MTEAIKTRHSHKRLWIGVTVGVVLLGIVLGLAWYVHSPHFEALVRSKLVATLEDMTGGRVEIGSFRWNLSQLSFEANDLTIHGLEAPGELPYVHVDRAEIELHIISFFERQVSLEKVDFEHPVIHVIVNPDGTTNAPEPKVKIVSNKTPVQELFDLAIGRVNFNRGMLLLNERRIPLDFAANDLGASMTYDRLAKRYDGHLEVGKMDATYQDWRDVAARGNLEISLWPNLAEVKTLKLTSERFVAGDQGKGAGLQSTAASVYLQRQFEPGAGWRHHPMA